MGNAQEIESIDSYSSSSIQSSDKKKNKNKSNSDKEKEFASNILHKFINEIPNISKLSLQCASEDIKKSLIPPKYLYNIQFEIPQKFELDRMEFEDKVIIFRDALKHLEVDWRAGSDYINVKRENILKESMEQFEQINPYRELKINFLGEVNQDAGGLIREWFTVIFQELQKEEAKLFQVADTQDYSLKLYENLECKKKKNKDIFNFIGKLLAKALLQNLTVNTCFNKYIFKLIIDEPIKEVDLVFIDQKLYHSFQKMRECKNIEDLELYFCIDNKKEDGSTETIDLIINGSNTKITNDNFDFYLEKRIKYMIYKHIILINELKKGLFSIIPEKLIKEFFSADQFELLINGTPFIDISDWQEHTIYNGYYTNSQIIIDFWDIISDFTQDKLGKLLQFCTGSCRVPIGGFKSLESNRGEKAPFSIFRIEYNKNKNNYIRAHTCFNRIEIPEFPTKNMLKDAINFILENDLLGFGID